MKKFTTILILLLLAISSVAAASPFDTGYEQNEQQRTGDNCHVVCEPTPITPQFDVVFLIDSTGSMNDEIRSVKTHIINLVEEAQQGNPRPDIKIGVVTYRDHSKEEPDYLVRKYDLTSNTEAALRFLKKLEAEGGGDHPEAVADGLHEAIADMDWRSNSRRIIFLVGDAAPHGEGSRDQSYEQGCPEGHNYRTEIAAARDKGITIYTVSGSGMDSVGIRVWKELAAETGGEYEALDYVRQDVDQYYEEQGIDSRWAGEAKRDTDYDKSSNSILTNNLGDFAKKVVKQEAMEAGVVYDSETEEENHPFENEIFRTDTSGSEGKLLAFLRNALQNFKFWE